MKVPDNVPDGALRVVPIWADHSMHWNCKWNWVEHSTILFTNDVFGECEIANFARAQRKDWVVEGVLTQNLMDIHNEPRQVPTVRAAVVDAIYGLHRHMLLCMALGTLPIWPSFVPFDHFKEEPFHGV